jgi:hypothetical protein
MFRKLSFPIVMGLAVVVGSAVSPAAQEVTGTVVLKSGERHTGNAIDYRVDRRVVSVRTGQHTQPRVDVNQVAYVDFGGAPDVNLNLTGSQEAVVLKDGTVLRGQVIEMAHENAQAATGPFLVIIRDTNGQEHRFPVERVGRVYFAGGTSAGTSGSGGGTTGSTAGGGVVVSGKQPWTSTGIMVRRGEVLRFNTTGEVRVGGGPDDVAPPAGVTGGRTAAGTPIPASIVGALIGRIGNGQPFGIGNQTSVPMPAAGMLFLGVNDNNFADNSGEFRVEITRGSSGIRR